MRVLEDLSSYNCEVEFKSGIEKKQKTSDLVIVAWRLTTEFISIDSM